MQQVKNAKCVRADINQTMMVPIVRLFQIQL